MTDKERVLIAGAGPVGLTAAANLVRQGVPVTVFEAGSDLSTESRASTFHPPTLDMLDALGAAKPLIAQGLVAPTFQYRTTDGRPAIKTPSGTLSTAEAISVVTNGVALAAHFGDGRLRAADVASGLVGAVVKDPVQDRIVWQEYLEAVVKERDGWKDLYRACRDAM